MDHLFISLLHSHKSSGPNSIPVRILRPQENDITQQLSDIFMSFLIGQFPSVLKIADLITINKKQSKDDLHKLQINIAFLYNTGKIIEKLLQKRLSHFANINNLIY